MAAAVRFLNPPEKFTKPLTWLDWKQKFNRYLIATKLNKEDGEIKVSNIIYTMGREAECIFKSFNFEGDEKRLNKVIEKFDEHFVPNKGDNRFLEVGVTEPARRHAPLIFLENPRFLKCLSQHFDITLEQNLHLIFP